jgi:hypothetical protein
MPSEGVNLVEQQELKTDATALTLTSQKFVMLPEETTMLNSKISVSSKKSVKTCKSGQLEFERKTISKMFSSLFNTKEVKLLVKKCPLPSEGAKIVGE